MVAAVSLQDTFGNAFKPSLFAHHPAKHADTVCKDEGLRVGVRTVAGRDECEIRTRGPPGCSRHPLLPLSMQAEVSPSALQLRRRRKPGGEHGTVLSGLCRGGGAGDGPFS